MLVILDSGNGQMCNKILMHINVLASAYIRGYKVKYYNLEKFDGPAYEQKELNNAIRVVDKNPRILKRIVKYMYLLLSMLHIKNKYFICAENEKDIAEALETGLYKRRRVWLFGWPFFDLDSLRKCKDSIREYLRPNENVKKTITEKKDKIKGKDENSILIGVHLRRGDYKEWYDGKYYFDDAVYKRYINMLYSELPEKKSVKVVLFSNERINIDFFKNDEYDVIVSDGSAIEDLYLMSECDYIIGPPSTFSGLASFIGNSPKYSIVDCDSILKQSDLRVWLIETDNWVNPYNG